MAAQRLLKGIRFTEASVTEMKNFLPTLRRQTGENATVSDVVRHSIDFALRHRAEMIAELKKATA